jgi:hypothetical protein
LEERLDIHEFRRDVFGEGEVDFWLFGLVRSYELVREFSGRMGMGFVVGVASRFEAVLSLCCAVSSVCAAGPLFGVEFLLAELSRSVEGDLVSPLSVGLSIISFVRSDRCISLLERIRLVVAGGGVMQPAPALQMGNRNSPLRCIHDTSTP